MFSFNTPNFILRFVTGETDYQLGIIPYPYFEAEYAENADIKKIEVWYPKELETSGGKYPVVLFVNGTSVAASRYEPVVEHLASWGFIAVGNEKRGMARFYSLLKIFHLEDRLMQSDTTLQVIHNPILWKQVNETLNKERERAFTFFKVNL